MLNKKYYEDEVFTQDHLVSLEEGEFYSCTFEKINLPESSFRNSNFFECKFNNCNFSNSDVLGTRFNDIEFLHCKLIGINWCTSKGINELVFKNSVLDYNVFQEMKLMGLKALDCSLKEVDFSECDLKDASFSKSNLISSNFNHANLEGADFSEAVQYYLDPKTTKLKNAKFSMPEAIVLLKALGVEIL